MYDAGAPAYAWGMQHNLDPEITSSVRKVLGRTESKGARRMARQVPEGKALLDPPLLRLEAEAGHAYLGLLLHLHSAASPQLREAADVEQRLAALCAANLAAFEVGRPKVPV